jgi:hypothetical protein
MSTVYDRCGVTSSFGPRGVLSVDTMAANRRVCEAGLILSSCKNSTSGQLCRERKPRSELCGPWPTSVSASLWPIGLKYEVIGAAEAGTNGCRPLIFQDMTRIVCGRAMVVSEVSFDSLT